MANTMVLALAMTACNQAPHPSSHAEPAASTKPASPSELPPPPVSIPETTPTRSIQLPEPIPDASPQKKKEYLESYSVTVSANEQLKIPGPPGELRVWIGISSRAPRTQPNMITETKELEAIGETARVTPFTLGIDVAPKVSLCEKIDPSGSEVRFRLIPGKSGTFTVGADVELFDSKDCSGSPIPKSAKSVAVRVVVDDAGVIKNALKELANTAWKAFLTFWDKALVLFFGLLLFLIRKKLFQWFKFKGKK